MKTLDLKHLARVDAILKAIPDDTDIGHALIALEDAGVLCLMALQFGLTLTRARELSAEMIETATAEQIEAQRRINEHL